ASIPIVVADNILDSIVTSFFINLTPRPDKSGLGIRLNEPSNKRCHGCKAVELHKTDIVRVSSLWLIYIVDT
ncbi:MAG: hypothetical protein V2A72_07560, partial [Candidatus Omnitrophota bacterium]